jgi:hypothetical protein
MKVVLIAIIGIVIVLAMFGFIQSSVHSVQAPDYTQTFNAVATASTTNATVILNKDLFEGDVGNVTSVTSDNELDTPAAEGYTVLTKSLVITGLNESDTRQLVVVYGEDQLATWSYMPTLASALPFIIVIGAVGLLGYGAYKGIMGRR